VAIGEFKPRLSPFLSFTVLLLIGCDSTVDNTKAQFGKETGLPSNCRAYVQVAIESYRSKSYTADETITGLERNCGANGSLWSN
jgi:hypothetical protein